uniref:Uncharacterized protein n=1 Tax=Vitis vinifera TaxID=29760 RepID=A5AG08_VITVI|nr:hypothetical protein VITISV_002116 [Vitis vinifera]
MGGKGRRRREKNYRAAHGGHERLPPPPDLSKLDALPSKLRKLMAFTSPSTPQRPQGSAKASIDKEKKGKRGDAEEKGKETEDWNSYFTFPLKKQKENSTSQGLIRLFWLVRLSVCCLGTKQNFIRRMSLTIKLLRLMQAGDGDHFMTSQDMEDNDGTVPSSTHEKGKRKRKRKQVKDLRFEAELEKVAGLGSKRRERKKKYLESRKKKHKKAKTEENLDFPRHEKIKFGEVVEAPPKLVAVPKALKALKTVQDASQERLRLQAVDAYRKRKGWVFKARDPSSSSCDHYTDIIDNSLVLVRPIFNFFNV